QTRKPRRALSRNASPDAHSVQAGPGSRASLAKIQPAPLMLAAVPSSASIAAMPCGNDRRTGPLDPDISAGHVIERSTATPCAGLVRVLVVGRAAFVRDELRRQLRRHHCDLLARRVRQS